MYQQESLTHSAPFWPKLHVSGGCRAYFVTRERVMHKHYKLRYTTALDASHRPVLPPRPIYNNRGHIIIRCAPEASFFIIFTTDRYNSQNDTFARKLYRRSEKQNKVRSLWRASIGLHASKNTGNIIMRDRVGLLRRTLDDAEPKKRQYNIGLSYRYIMSRLSRQTGSRTVTNKRRKMDTSFQISDSTINKSYEFINEVYPTDCVRYMLIALTRSMTRLYTTIVVL